MNRRLQVMFLLMLAAVMTVSCKLPCDPNDPKSDCYIPPEERIEAMFNFKGTQGVYDLAKEINEFVKSPDFIKNPGLHNIQFKSDGGFSGALDEDMTSVTMTMEEIYKIIRSFNVNEVKSGGMVDPWEMNSTNENKWRGWGYTVQTNDPRHNTTYNFTTTDFSNVKPTDKIKASSDSTLVRYVYLEPKGKFDDMQSGTISAVINNVLKPAMEISVKVKGKGNFEFYPGEILLPDSMWIVSNGWTVNQH